MNCLSWSLIVLEEEKCYNLMISILKAVSSHHLRILDVDYPFVGCPDLKLIPSPLPSLVELSVSGSLRPTSLTESLVAPSLRRLYFRSSPPQGSFCAELKRIAPLLTHLRMNGHANATLDFLFAYCKSETPLWMLKHRREALQYTVAPDGTPVIVPNDEGVRTGLEERVQAWEPLPDNLHRVVVEYSSYIIPSGFSCGNARRSHFEVKRVGWRIAEEGQRCGKVLVRTEQDSHDLDTHRPSTDRSVLFLPMPQAIHEADLRTNKQAKFAQAKVDWLERTTGNGKGYWP